MDDLLGLFDQVIHDESALQWLFIAIVGLSVASMSLAVMFVMSGVLSPTRKRLRNLLVPASPRQDAGANADKFMEALEPLAQVAMPSQEKEAAGMSQRLRWAGFRSSGAVGFYYSLKLLMALALPCLIIAYSALFGGISNSTLFVYVSVAAAAGNFLPSMYLNHVLKKRQKLLRHGFPDALDLLVVCVEAGLGLKAAIARVADELVSSHPDLAAEFELLNAELRAGVETSEALGNLASRNGLDDIRGFAALLSQSMRFGTSIGETLRVYSNEFREKRMQKAEEAAAKLSIKMLFPMVVCIFPSFFVVAIGPAILLMIGVFSG